MKVAAQQRDQYQRSSNQPNTSLPVGYPHMGRNTSMISGGMNGGEAAAGRRWFMSNTIPNSLTLISEWYERPALVAIDSGLIPSRVRPMTSKLLFTAFPLDNHH